MENYIVIKAFPGVKVGTVLTWCNVSDAFKSGKNVFEPSEVINNKEFFTIATDLVYVAVLDAHEYEVYYVTNTYVGRDYSKAEMSLIGNPYGSGFSICRTIETWVNGVKISDKEID